MEESPARWRRTASWVGVVLTAVLVFVSVIALWARATIADTDRYVATVAPLAADPAIQEAITNRVVTVLFEGLDVEQLTEEVLPERASFLAQPLVGALESFVRDQVSSVLASDKFQEVWTQVNEFVHRELLNVLLGDTGSVRVDDGRVVIDLSGVFAAVKERLHESGIDIFDSVNLPPDRTTIVLFQSDTFGAAQQALSALNTTATVLPWLTLLVGGATIALSLDRRRCVSRLAAGVVLAMVLLLVGLVLARSLYLGALPTSVSYDAARAFFDTLLFFLRQSARVVLTVAVVAWLVSWFVGPSHSAVAVRDGLRRLAGRAPQMTNDENDLTGRLGTSVRAHLPLCRGAVGVAAAVVLIAWTQPTVRVVVLLAIVAALFLALLELLAAQAGSAPRTSG